MKLKRPTNLRLKDIEEKLYDWKEKAIREPDFAKAYRLTMRYVAAASGAILRRTPRTG